MHWTVRRRLPSGRRQGLRLKLSESTVPTLSPRRGPTYCSAASPYGCPRPPAGCSRAEPDTWARPRAPLSGGRGPSPRGGGVTACGPARPLREEVPASGGGSSRGAAAHSSRPGSPPRPRPCTDRYAASCGGRASAGGRRAGPARLGLACSLPGGHQPARGSSEG